ncbi:hypothetical protein BLL42_04075 [Pseudomonas frederiksbergensis]|uniref:Uncharacterized protein n=1 Tax=Pseudomonas frederiksbergensis TaxID=104087 RepID=A0A1J0EGJ8_9PSED|nr:hypothetical protein [Pseudomonas frederiksbergensis]APC14932.1 hypothetical protein BLL42_04075 [Pseudomonas frederiksbergensis]
MAKPQEDPMALDQAITTSPLPAPGGSTATFRDTVYTSRTLILSDDRELAVAKGIVSVSTTDAMALKFFKDNAEFEPLKE